MDLIVELAGTLFAIVVGVMLVWVMFGVIVFIDRLDAWLRMRRRWRDER